MKKTSDSWYYRCDSVPMAKDVCNSMTKEQLAGIHYFLGKVYEDPMLAEAIRQIKTLDHHQRLLFDVSLKWTLIQPEK